MRKEVPAKDIRPGDTIWFSGDRKPGRVIFAEVQDGAEKLVVLTGETKIWYLPFETGQVYQYEEDEPVVEEDEAVYLDPDGNPT